MKVIIASRMSSSRLPGKALRPIFKNKTMLDVLVHRINQSKLVSGIILATSDHESDDPLVSWAEKKGVDCFRGSLDDVLGRLNSCLKQKKVKNFLEILGDNPLVDPQDIDRCIKIFEDGHYDYVATSTTEYDYAEVEKSYPVGIRVQCMKSTLIANASRDFLDAHNREHSSSFIYSKDNGYKTKLIEYPHNIIKDAYRLNLAVNTASDFSRTTNILQACGLDATIDKILEYVFASNKI